ncbi:GTPase HflX [Anaerosalibacter sp. Marseille-P3206]|uniref:GTPase HflX n=1 Tax=Anaerosalibacter sp. Marseille-P3206 TaxID=1871005 RepID=UPI0009867A99|nr:GTPase HflX [Anaerosalibacter sp. Marseille-P3206]
MNETREYEERILTVGVDLGNTDFDIESSMDELEELIKAANGHVIERVIQKRYSIDAANYIGKGKAVEIKNYCFELDIDTVVFNDELSPAQIRNLEDIIERKIIDRTNLILDIFAKRATSKEGKLQVKLAQLKYRLPRLVGMRKYLSREGGGIGTRGPGEMKLETDRRHILREIDRIEAQLKGMEKVRKVKRKQRLDSNLPVVALVGYTNAGKSTLLNKIIECREDYDSSKKVYVYDMLFATLDTSLRKAQLPNGQDFLVTDTVGFVSKLPTKLVEAFKGTLEEIKFADVLLHVVDSSNLDLDLQLKTTIDILEEMEVLDKPIITVFNKMDMIDVEQLIYDNKFVNKKVFISAKDGTNMDVLFEMIQDSLPVEYKKVTMLIPYSSQSLLSNILDNYVVDEMKHEENGTRIVVDLNMIDYEKYFEYVIDR